MPFPFFFLRFFGWRRFFGAYLDGCFDSGPFQVARGCTGMRHIRPEQLPASPLARDVLRRFCDQAHRMAGDRIGRIIVYGSMARGDAGPESDLDVWVDWRGREADGTRLLGDLGAHLFVDTGLIVSVHVVDAEHLRRLADMDAMFLRNVQREGVVVEG